MSYNLQFVESDSSHVADVRNAKAIPVAGSFAQFGPYSYEVLSVCHGYLSAAGGTEYRDDLIQITVRPE